MDELAREVAARAQRALLAQLAERPDSLQVIFAQRSAQVRVRSLYWLMMLLSWRSWPSARLAPGHLCAAIRPGVRAAYTGT